MVQRRALTSLLWLVLSLGAARAADVPRQSPEFAINLLGGKQILLSQYRGKVVALIFILTYCPHCQKTVQALAKDQTEFGPRGFQVLSSAIEDMANMYLPDFLKRFNPPFPVGYNERPPVVQYLQHDEKFQLLMPQLVFVDREGTIRAQYAGDDKFFDEPQDARLRAKIIELLGPAPAAKKTLRKK